VSFSGEKEPRIELTRCRKTKEGVGVLRFLAVGRAINRRSAALAVQEFQLEKKVVKECEHLVRM
jgi:hypothetical protein